MQFNAKSFRHPLPTYKRHRQAFWHEFPQSVVAMWRHFEHEAEKTCLPLLCQRSAIYSTTELSSFAGLHDQTCLMSAREGGPNTKHNTELVRSGVQGKEKGQSPREDRVNSSRLRYNGTATTPAHCELAPFDLGVYTQQYCVHPPKMVLIGDNCGRN